jgi:hypothetical protein
MLATKREASRIGQSQNIRPTSKFVRQPGLRLAFALRSTVCLPRARHVLLQAGPSRQIEFKEALTALAICVLSGGPAPRKAVRQVQYSCPTPYTFAGFIYIRRGTIDELHLSTVAEADTHTRPSHGGIDHNSLGLRLRPSLETATACIRT